MSWTTTKVSEFSVGDQKQQLWTLTADSATLELSTGLGYINHAVLSPSSMNSANSKYAINVLSAATASKGTVSVTGCTSGDRMYLTVYGR